MQENKLVDAIFTAIAKMEGYFPPQKGEKTTRAWRNCNPGNIWDGIGKGKLKRIWPNIPIDSKGYLIYPSHEDGIRECKKQIVRMIRRGQTLQELITKWAPPTENNTDEYIAFVAKRTGIDPDAKIMDLKEFKI